MPENAAAYLTTVDQPLEVMAAPYPTPQANEIIVQSRAIAVNPCDWAAQWLGPALFPYLKLPAIFGEDVAGDVVALGPGVNNFKIGDRVTCSSMTAFQKYPTIHSHMAAKIPDSTSYEEAAVIPLGLTTALVCLFHKDHLALDMPSVNYKPNGKSLLIWGGSTSVGCNAIQCAVAGGYEVITTASPRNFDFVKRLGASQVFDYKSASVQQDLITALKGKPCAGAMAISDVTPESRKEVAEACIAIIAQTEGRKYVALTMPTPEGLEGGDVQFEFVKADGMSGEKDLGVAIFNRYLSEAVHAGKCIPAPSPVVVGHGLEALNEAMKKLKQGVSAQKLVVTV